MPQHDTPVIGIVSNCWRTQLEQGQSLADLVDEAWRRGFRAIELRQGALGEFEPDVAQADDSKSARERLRLLATRFPEIEFNLAVSLPVFGQLIAIDNQPFRAALHAVQSLSCDGQPHLRLVDTMTRTRELNTHSIMFAAKTLFAMTLRLVDAGGRLSVEHAYQSWACFHSVLHETQKMLAQDASKLRCCFDPCNLLLTESAASIPAIVESVAPCDVSMIHLKQSRSGQVLPDLGNGDLSWKSLIQALRLRGHQGPWLFEVAPDQHIWDNLERSRQLVTG